MEKIFERLIIWFPTFKSLMVFYFLQPDVVAWSQQLPWFFPNCIQQHMTMNLQLLSTRKNSKTEVHGCSASDNFFWLLFRFLSFHSKQTRFQPKVCRTAWRRCTVEEERNSEWLGIWRKVWCPRRRRRRRSEVVKNGWGRDEAMSTSKAK